MRDFWGRKTICLVTGASQNIGRVFAEEVSKLLGPGSILILTSRSQEKLGVVRQSAYEINPKIRIELFDWDLAHPDSQKFDNDLREMLKLTETEARDYELALLVHNARTSVGEHGPKLMLELIDGHFIQDHLNINLTSMLVLNSAFFSVFKQVREKVLIDMTSLPEKMYGLNMISKASRTLALNIFQQENPEIRILHYSPGVVESSSILQTIIKSTRGDPEVTRKLQELYEQNKILKPKQTVDVLLKFLQENEIEPFLEIDAQQLIKKEKS